MRRFVKSVLIMFTALSALSAALPAFSAKAASGTLSSAVTSAGYSAGAGGGKAVTGQLEGMGYAAFLYDSSNGLPTSDANAIVCTRNGFIWIGSYCGLIMYDGTNFGRMDTSFGVTNGNALFEDSKARLWVGSNDNGLIVFENDGTTRRYDYEDGLTSLSIRTITEDEEGNIIVGTTSGICYVDRNMELHRLDSSIINDAYITRLVTDSEGTVFGSTKAGAVFGIRDLKLKGYINGDDIGVGEITTVYPDPSATGRVYLGTKLGFVCVGSFSDNFASLEKTYILDSDKENLNSNDYVTWITYAADRVWILTRNKAGYLDTEGIYRSIDNLPMTGSFGSMIEDYEGNLWFTSDRQGVMKIVANKFTDVFERAGLDNTVVNTTCMHRGNLYIGTDKGLIILDPYYNRIENKLTSHLGHTRIRCMMEDDGGNLWISTYTNDLGVVCYTSAGKIEEYNEENGLPSNEARGTSLMKDGSILVGTNGGLAVIRDHAVVRTVTAESGLLNTIILTAIEGDDGRIYLGTDGDGIYVIDGTRITKLGRSDGLGSEVVMRITKDEKTGVYWIVTSNSIAFMKDGKITTVSKFPYSNNYDILFDADDNAWVLASNGLYVASAEAMMSGEEFEYAFYDTASGLPSVATGNSYSELMDDGTLYIAGRTGVSRVNINNYFSFYGDVRLVIPYIEANGEYYYPENEEEIVLPSTADVITINGYAITYSLQNPKIRCRLEGFEKEGTVVLRTDLPSIRYTNVPGGEYTYTMSVINNSGDEVYKALTLKIIKKKSFGELAAVRIAIALAIMMIVALVVWGVLKTTIINRQNEELKQAKDEADRANSAKSRFLANMSHEIRTPINTIMGMDEMILRENRELPVKAYSTNVVKYAASIKTASESLLGMINDILDLSKIESGKMNLVCRDYQVVDLLRSITTMIRVRANEKGLEFRTEIDPELPSGLYGDDGKIKQVILNLLTNAVKYTRQGGFTLKVRVSSIDGDSCRIDYSVRDSGIGIKPEDMERLFVPFERLDEHKNTGIQGTGLGLDISRQFVELMGSELKCDSVYGEGSNFYFTLEQKVVDAEPMGEFSESGGEEIRTDYVPLFVAPEARAMVVDDNEMNLMVIQGLLERTKIRLSLVNSGKKCLEEMQNGDYDIVLLDHMMPEMDGIETLHEIRKTHPDIPAVILTANIATNGEDYYKNEGFQGYLAKPVDGGKLEEVLKSFLPAEKVREWTPGEDEQPEAEEHGEASEQELFLEKLSTAEGIDISAGIRFCGSRDAFIKAVGNFRDALEERAGEIETAYVEEDWELYTIKVHALKSSARIIGAAELSEKAGALEEAGINGDIDAIRKDTGEMMSLYRNYLEKIPGADAEGDEDKEEASREMIDDAWEAMRDIASAMDYDSAEMVIEDLKGYRLPQKEAERFDELKHMVKSLDWDGISRLIEERMSE